MERLQAIVLADGDAVAPAFSLDGDIVIAADGGLGLAAPLGLDVSVVVGDMDSVDPEQLAAAERDGARIERHPTDKNATDLELAIDAALAAGAGAITIVGGSGGRFDHWLANAMLLAGERYRDVLVRWLAPSAQLTVCDPQRPATIDGNPGDVVSLIPIGSRVAGVNADGLRWPLTDATLPLGSTRGVSNEIITAPATVTVDDGTLFVVHLEPGQ